MMLDGDMAIGDNSSLHVVHTTGVTEIISVRPGKCRFTRNHPDAELLLCGSFWTVRDLGLNSGTRGRFFVSDDV